MADNTNFLTPIHPGEVLSEEFMEPYGLSANRLAQDLSVPTNRITAIIKGTRSITADTAIRLSEAFGTTPQFWMNLQNRYDLEVASQQERPAVKHVIARPAKQPKTLARQLDYT